MTSWFVLFFIGYIASTAIILICLRGLYESARIANLYRKRHTFSIATGLSRSESLVFRFIYQQAPYLVSSLQLKHGIPELSEFDISIAIESLLNKGIIIERFGEYTLPMK